MNIKALTAWCLYDAGLAAFPVIVTTFVIATYFTSVVAVNEIEGTRQWGDAMALAGILVAFLSPVLGAVAENTGKRKQWLGVFTTLVVLSSTFLWFAYPSSGYIPLILTCVVIGTVGVNISMVFYNALLPTLVPDYFVGRLSGWGWGLGYLGGLSILLIIFLGFVDASPHWLDRGTFEQIRICGPLVALWTLLLTLPLFILVQDKSKKQLSLQRAVQCGMQELWSTLKKMPREKNVLIFLIAQMIYMDGLNTLFAFGGIYAAGTFQMPINEVLMLGIAMNIFAGLGSILFAWIDDWIGSKITILLSIFLLSVLGLFIVLTHSNSVFWILACLLSLFVGPIQSSSRSLMTRIIPKEKATEMFGLYIFSGKVTAFIGPWLLGTITLAFNSQRIGMGTILIFFIIGGCILTFVRQKPSQKQLPQRE